jgi:small-conductance mechanosensitive channel
MQDLRKFIISFLQLFYKYVISFLAIFMVFRSIGWKKRDGSEKICTRRFLNKKQCAKSK